MGARYAILAPPYFWRIKLYFIFYVFILVPNATDTEHFKWDPSSPGYGLDLAFAACEWCVGLIFVSYFVTLYPDFKVNFIFFNLKIYIFEKNDILKVGCTAKNSKVSFRNFRN